MLADLFEKPNDIFYLAEHCAEYRGDVEAARCPRLRADIVPDSTGSTNVLSIKMQAGKHPEVGFYIKLSVQGGVSLPCQRCLQPVIKKVDLHRSFGLVTDNCFAGRVPSPYDPLIIDSDDESLSIIHLIEDEIMLAWPLVIAHQEEDCNRLLNEIRPSPSVEGVMDDNAEEKAKKNPFLVLKQLKNQKN